MIVERTKSRIISVEPLGLIKGRRKDVSAKTLTISSSKMTLPAIINPGFILGSVMAAHIRDSGS